jgi:hypothetical protein
MENAETTRAADAAASLVQQDPAPGKRQQGGERWLQRRAPDYQRGPEWNTPSRPERTRQHPSYNTPRVRVEKEASGGFSDGLLTTRARTHDEATGEEAGAASTIPTGPGPAAVPGTEPGGAPAGGNSEK